MKRLITVTAILIVLIATKSKAQIIQAGGRCDTLTTAQIKFLRSKNIPAINLVLDSRATCKNNSTADLILALLHPKENRKV